MRKPVLLLALVLVVLGGAYWFWIWRPANQGARPAGAPGTAEFRTGGSLTVTQRTEPTTFNRYAVAQFPNEIFARLTQATLVRLNRASGALEPALAETWSVAPDNRTFMLNLRKGVTFSDGTPFTSADVLFSFQALYSPAVASPIASGMSVNGQPFAVRALDDHTVVLTFPAPYGPGLTILDALPILPKHKLERALAAGTFNAAWGTNAPAADFAGLGAFVFAEYVPAQYMRFTKNAKYWGKDSAGRALPYLDEITINFVPEQNAEMLRLQNGDTDLITEQIRPEDLAALERASSDGKVQLMEAGVSLDPVGMWFNLKSGAPAAKAKPWIQRDEFRLALSHAINRKLIVDTVYLGLAEPAFGPVTRGFGPWYSDAAPKTEFDAAKAKDLFAKAGLSDKNGDGKLDDASGKTATFAVLTRKGNTLLERTMASVQEQLAKAGLGMDIVALDRDPLLKQFFAGDYEAIYYGFPVGSNDPVNNSDYWLSSGAFHVWNPGQTAPATAWEKEIDDLMRKNSASMVMDERVKLFADVQRIFAEHLPMIYFAAAKATVAMSARVQGAVPALLQPQVLWKPEMLWLGGAARK
jgi:peptide/nickel transport system substrate-binding protein